MGSGRPQTAGHPVGAYGESERELTGKKSAKTGKGIALPGFVYESHAEANRQTGSYRFLCALYLTDSTMLTDAVMTFANTVLHQIMI